MATALGPRQHHQIKQRILNLLLCSNHQPLLNPENRSGIVGDHVIGGDAPPAVVLVSLKIACRSAGASLHLRYDDDAVEEDGDV